MTPEQTQQRDKIKERFHLWWEKNTHERISRGLAMSTWIAASYEALNIKDPAVYAQDLHPVDDSFDDLLGEDVDGEDLLG